MSELWLPSENKAPDVTNFFDMVMVFQEHLEFETDEQSKLLAARYARKALCNALLLHGDGKPDVTLIADWMMFPANPEGKRPVIDIDTGVNGFVGGVEIFQLPGEPMPSVGLEVEAITLFDVAEPEVIEPVMNQVLIPFRRVKYLETLAS